jgi:hypothetical protein
MQLVFQSQNLNFDETYRKLVASDEVQGLRRSGGGRGGDKTEHGNAVFSFKRLPEAKISISPHGTIQITVPASKREMLADSLQLVVNHLVMIREEKVKVLIATFSDLDDDRDRLKPPYTTEKALGFYKKVKSNLTQKLRFVESLLEALETRKKVVVIRENPTTGREGLFFGDWAREQMTCWLDDNLEKLCGQLMGYNGLIRTSGSCDDLLKMGSEDAHAKLDLENTDIICLFLLQKSQAVRKN